MSFITKFSITLIALGIVFALFGTSWFWAIIILFPIIVISQVFGKGDIGTLVLGVILVTIFGGTFIDAGIISIGDIIVFIYIILGLFVLGKMFGANKNNTDEDSPYIGFIIVTSIIGTLSISAGMPNPKPIGTTVPTSTGTVIPVGNTPK